MPVTMSPNIRQLYMPVQPTVQGSTGNVTYAEFKPAAELEDFILCYWQLKTTEALSEPFVYRVVADGCMDIFLELNAPQDNYVMGFCKRYTQFPLGKSFHYVGVRFLPTTFPQLFRVNAAELSDRFEPLVNVVPDLSGFIAGRFHAGTTTDELRSLLDGYFTGLVERTPFDDDGRLYRAIEVILKKSGVVNVEKDLDTGISPRQLRRLFEYYIGDTAKTFAKVVRFQNVLRAKPSSQSLRHNELFWGEGYYDQSHFIKEFKAFYGVTPSKAFGR